jgi:Flp pilus assembly protein TadG
MKSPMQRKQSKENGAVVVLVAFLLLILLGIAAFAIDFGYRHVVKNELQNAADAAALAGARELGKIYENSNIHPLDSTERTSVIAAAQNTALTNYAGDENDLEIDAQDVLFGHWDSSANPNVFIPEPTTERIDAVNVTVRRQPGYNSGPIRTFFAGLLGVETMDIIAKATAALTGQSTIGEGGLPIPVGIGTSWFDPNNWIAEEKGFCDQDIKMYPTGGLTGCAGWHVFQEDVNQANTNVLNGVLNQLNPWCDPDDEEHFDSKLCKKNEGQYDPENPYQSPEVSLGDSFIFTGGTVAASLPNMEFLYDAHKDENGVWPVTLVVYDIDTCGEQPSGSEQIAGFASAEIYDVETAIDGTKTIRARVVCEMIKPGRGGGADYGTLGSIPNLVE